MLTNTTFLRKISHSSQELRMDNIKGYTLPGGQPPSRGGRHRSERAGGQSPAPDPAPVPQTPLPKAITLEEVRAVLAGAEENPHMVGDH